MAISQPEFDADEQQAATALGLKRSACPPLDVLRAAGQDVLPPDVEARVTQHLAQCSLCRGLMEDFAALPEAGLTAEERSRVEAKLPLGLTSGAGSNRLWMGIAASILILLAGAVVWRSLSNNPAENQNAHVRTPVANLPQTVTASLEIPLTPLAPPDGTAMLTRGAGSPEPATEQLLPAFTAYDEGDYATAASRFHDLESSYPKSEIIPLYLGVSQLFLGQNENADASLTRALTFAGTNGATDNPDAARWYVAIAASRLHSPRATSLLKGLCGEKHSQYSAQSCRLLGVAQ